MSHILNPHHVVEFWFGQLDENDNVSASHRKRWFGGGSATDELIIKTLGDTHRAACQGELEHWRETAEGQLGLLILFDQISRNIYRGKPQSFAQDDLAIALAQQLLDQQQITVHRYFVLMAFEHQENEPHQRTAVSGFEQLLQDCSEHHQQQVQSFLQYALAHQQVIQRFGRFPHRNAILGRVSSADEVEYLRHNKGF